MGVWYKAALSILMAFIVCGVIWFFVSAKPQQLNARMHVVCTTTLIADAVCQIAGERVSVESLMGPGIDPHVYRARESDVHKLSRADLILYHGLHLEGSLHHLFSSMKSWRAVYAVAEAIPPDRCIWYETEQVYDPHVWHDVSLWIEVVQEICRILCIHDARHAAEYQARAAQYGERLRMLDEMIRAMVARVEPSRRVLVSAHDAFAYFGRAYGCSVIGLQGMSTDVEVSIADIEQLTSLIVERAVHTIFLESSVPERTIKSVQQAVLSREWQVTVGEPLYSDALGEPHSGAETYEQMMSYNVATMVAGMERAV